MAGDVRNLRGVPCRSSKFDENKRIEVFEAGKNSSVDNYQKLKKFCYLKLLPQLFVQNAF